MPRRWGELVEVRPWRPADERNLVVNSWVASWWRYSRPAMSPQACGPLIEEHLASCDQVLVAVVPGVARVIPGWIARARPGVIAYLYVLHDYRRQGIAERLLREAGIDPRGVRWRYVFGTPRMRQLCRLDEKRPDRVPWKGVPDGKDQRHARSGGPRHVRAAR